MAAGQSTHGALLSTVVIGCVNVACTVVAILAVDRIGRKPLLLQGGIQMVLTLVRDGGIYQGNKGGAPSDRPSRAVG